MHHKIVLKNMIGEWEDIYNLSQHWRGVIVIVVIIIGTS